MKRLFWLTLVLTAVLGFAASNVLARGGHGGGGHHGGGHHSGHHAQHHNHHGNHHNTHHHVAHHGQHHAFSHGWYGHHHGAWGWGNGGYGWGNPWAAATFGTAATWLGMSALDGGTGDQTVYTGSTDEPLNDQNEQVADSDSENDSATDPQEEESITQPAEAAALAAGGAAEPGADAKFLPLGVFSIAPAGENEASALVHLAVSKDGVLRGTYFDIKAGKDENIQGAVDKKDGSVAWTVGTNDKVVFHTYLEDLTEQSGPVSVRTENGQTHEWTIARYTEEEAKKSGGSETPAHEATTPEAKTGHQENYRNQ